MQHGAYFLLFLFSLLFTLGADEVTVQSTTDAFPIVRVNQVGYLPDSIKRATVVSSASSALDWSLKDKSGTEIASGTTTPKSGVDKASGDAVHDLDFSSAQTSGSGFTLVVTENGKKHKSHPFDISKSIYSEMKKDALAQSSLPEAEVKNARNACAAAADEWIKNIGSEGYRVPITVGPTGYPWGSNSFILNQMIVMALAHDFTKNAKYFNSITVSMGYILGRNANDKCYVSGYGERPLENPHHRFWAYQANNAYPKLPAGVVSGGPNSGLQDSYAQGAVPKVNGSTPPAKCFVDHIDSWSTNEITINWNAPLAWITAYLDENSNSGTTPVKHTFDNSVKTHALSPVVTVNKNNLIIALGTKKKADISIHSVNGRILFAESITAKTGAIAIGCHSFAHTSGLYIVDIKSQFGNVCKSVIIQR